MEYGLAREELKNYVGDAFTHGLPAVYIISARHEEQYLKIGMVRYGDLSRRMGNFLTWSRGFKIHYVIYTDTILNVNKLENEIHRLLAIHNHKRLPFEPNIYFKKLSEWFEVKPKEIEKLFQEIKTPVVNILKLHKTSDYFHKRKQRIKNSNHITEIKIKQKEIKNKNVRKSTRLKKTRGGFPVRVGNILHEGVFFN